MDYLPNPTLDNLQKEQNRYKNSQILLDNKQWLYVQKQYSLTIRERQIAELICQGLRNENIAGHLRITSGTVKTHIRNIYRKIHVKNKIGMLLRFVAASRDSSPATVTASAVTSTPHEDAILSPVTD